MSKILFAMTVGDHGDWHHFRIDDFDKWIEDRTDGVDPEDHPKFVTLKELFARSIGYETS